jgi:hypothetical protein
MTKEDRQAELNYIYETALLNGYAGHQTKQSATHRQITTLTPQEKEAQKYATNPYFLKITNKVVNIFAKQRVRLVFTKENKLRNQLGSPKGATQTWEKSGMGETCIAVYVEQTRRTVIKRCITHRREQNSS